MNILITGGSGSLGKTVLSLIDRTKHNIYAPSSSECNLMDLGSIKNYIYGKNINFVIHLAANVGGLYKNISKKVEMLHENLIMNEYVLKACYEAGIKSGIFILSTCVFPYSPKKYPMTEDDIFDGVPHPSNENYAYAKRMLYLQCKNYNSQFGTNYKCLTPTNLYGKFSKYDEQDSHVIPALISKFYNAKEKLLIPVGKRSRRQFVHSKDLSMFILKCLENFENIEWDNKICTGPEILLTDVIREIALHFSKEYEIVDIEQGQVLKTCSSKWGDIPISISLEEGIKEMIEEYMNGF